MPNLTHTSTPALETTTFTRSFNGRNFPGMDSHVLRPMTTAFIVLVSVLVLVLVFASCSFGLGPEMKSGPELEVVEEDGKPVVTICAISWIPLGDIATSIFSIDAGAQEINGFHDDSPYLPDVP